MQRTLLALLALASVSLFSTGCEKLKARDNLNKGVQAYKSAQYSAAVERFEDAVKLDPTFSVARLYLAMAYYIQYIPGADSPENQQMADRAYSEFKKVLDQDPNNDVATQSIASLFFNQKKWDESETWYKKALQINPNNKEAYYTLGVIAWTKWFHPWAEARAKLGMTQEAPGPIKDKKIREELRANYSGIIDEGIKNLQKALELDKEYDDAMAYMNLLIRERADTDDNSEQYQKDVETANNWVQQALQTKKIKAERKPTSQGITAEAK